MLRAGPLGFDPRTAVTSYRPGAPATTQTAWSEKAGTQTIREHTLLQIFREIFPFTNWCSNDGSTCVQFFTPEEQAAKAIAQRDANFDALRAMARDLPTCPAESITGDRECYYGRALPYVADNVGIIDGPLLPGTFSAFGAVLTLTDYKDNSFRVAYTPTAPQRRVIEQAIIWQSLNYLLGLQKKTEPPIYGGAIKAALRDRGILNDDPSVDQVMAAVPDVALFWPYFERNPVQPTPTERTQRGGWKAWITRGGYPLSRSVLTGRIALTDTPIGLNICGSVACGCSANGMPSCNPLDLKTQFGIAPNFWPYVAMRESAPVVEFALVVENVSWVKKFGEFMADKIVALGRATCGQTNTTQEASTKSGQIALAAYAVMLSKMCQAWNAENAPRAALPDPTPDQTPSVYAPPAPGAEDKRKTAERLPYVVAGAAGLLLGLAAAWRVSR